MKILFVSNKFKHLKFARIFYYTFLQNRTLHVRFRTVWNTPIGAGVSSQKLYDLPSPGPTCPKINEINSIPVWFDWVSTKHIGFLYSATCIGYSFKGTSHYISFKIQPFSYYIYAIDQIWVTILMISLTITYMMTS